MGQRFFLPLLVRIAVVTAGPLAVAWWFGGPIAGAAAAVAAGSLELWRIAHAVRNGAQDRVAYTTTPPKDLGWLDEDAIRAALTELKTIGFRPIADCAFEVPGRDPGFARVLAHRHQRVYAQVTQTRRGMHAPERVAICIFSVLADGRTLTTTTARLHPALAFGLEATDAWQLRPTASSEELMVTHLTTREQMSAAHGTAVAGDGSLEGYVTAQSELYRRQAEACRSGGALRAIARGLRWERGGNLTWLDRKLTRLPAIAVATRRAAGQHQPDGAARQPTSTDADTRRTGDSPRPAEPTSVASGTT